MCHVFKQQCCSFNSLKYVTLLLFTYLVVYLVHIKCWFTSCVLQTWWCIVHTIATDFHSANIVHSEYWIVDVQEKSCLQTLEFRIWTLKKNWNCCTLYMFTITCSSSQPINPDSPVELQFCSSKNVFWSICCFYIKNDDMHLKVLLWWLIEKKKQYINQYEVSHFEKKVFSFYSFITY